MVDAKELKIELGARAKDIIADGIGLRVRKGGNVQCPSPTHTDKHPSMSWFNEGLMWRCHACQEQIDIYDYLTKYRHMDFKDAVTEVSRMLGKSEQPIMATKTEYVKPRIDTRELSQPFIDYMAKRKIEKATLDFWKVRERTWNGKPVYVFQYFNDNNDLEYVSYRGLGKGAIKGGCEKDTKPILWGMWNIDKKEPLVITEGQPDAMAVWQAGYKNVVSVPNGSSNLTWINHCWDWLQEIPKFIVFADNDKPGLEMARNIQKKLKNVTILTSERKDANEVLFYDGPEKLKELIDEKINELPTGLLDLAQIDYKSAMEEEQDTIETGFYQYDSHVEDWKKGELTVIFGRNGEGKTTFISQIIAHNINRDTKTFLYSGEMSENKIQDWLYKQIIGNRPSHYRTIITKYRDKKEPKPETIKQIKEWHNGKLFLYDRTVTTEQGIDKFFEVIELASKRFGVKLFVIDNLMSILEENADSLYSDQANFVQRCKFFAINNDVHVVLLAHPNKEKDEILTGLKGNLAKTDISGSNNIANKADNIIAVERLWGDDRPCDAIVTSLKDRESGQRLVIEYFFSNQTLRFYNNSTKQEVNYSWTKEKSDKGFQITTSKDCPF